MSEAITEIIGCDLGDQYSHLCVLDAASGEVICRKRLRTTASALAAFFADRARARIAIEVGTHSRWVNQLLRSTKHEVIVANPRHVRLIFEGNRKNDHRDAETLARLVRADPKLLSPVRHRGQKAHADLMVLRSRDGVVEARSKLIVQVRGMCKALGKRLPKCEAETFARRARPQLPDDARAALEPVLDAIEVLTAQIKKLDAELSAMCKRYPETQPLRTVHGVGEVTSMAYVLTLEDPHRFTSSRDAAAIIGLVPKQMQSGSSDPQLRISKAGDALVRKLLVQCAHYILGPFGKDSDLRRYGEKLIARGGKRAKKKAVIAVARKLAVLLHRLWITGEVYEPLNRNTPRLPPAAAA